MKFVKPIRLVKPIRHPERREGSAVSAIEIGAAADQFAAGQFFNKLSAQPRS
jgi:hypothetical protein